MKDKIDIQKGSKVMLDGESHYVRKNGMTYCGKAIHGDVKIRNSIQIVTCGRCINAFILYGML
jgi:hypothetical protein